MEAGDRPSETLVDTVLRSHRALARLHEDEIALVREREREIVDAARIIQGFAQEIDRTIQGMRPLQDRQEALLQALEDRHQGFLKEFDRKYFEFSRKAQDSFLKQLSGIDQESAKRMKPVLDQLAASLQMEVDALGKKVSENTHNAIHDLDAFNSAVRRHTKNWQDQTAKLYGRILIFSILGGFSGAMAALLVARFVH
jgi:FtsZ-binding cell division protein ZapB